MTSRDHARRTGQDSRAVRLGAAGEREEPFVPRASLPDRLAAARERKGVDLTRAERDTKIRARYLSALETGDYGELPGAVYTKGFLRNYGAYLGLDPEYLVDLYRLESAQPSTERLSVPAPPRPIANRRRSLIVTPGAIWAALLTAVVLGIIV